MSLKKGSNGGGFDLFANGVSGIGEGAGGGWSSTSSKDEISKGSSLLNGGVGGMSCKEASLW